MLLAARVVLSAAHCFSQAVGTNGAASACIGASTHACQQSARVEAVVQHPAFKTGGFEHDLAVVLLDDALDATFPELAREGPTAPGGTVEVEGFGRTAALDAAGIGERHVRVVAVEEVLEEELQLAESACRCDSGGGVYRVSATGQRTLLGVNSLGPPECVPSNFAIRVDRARAFIGPSSTATAIMKAVASDRPEESRPSCSLSRWPCSVPHVARCESGAGTCR